MLHIKTTVYPPIQQTTPTNSGVTKAVAKQHFESNNGSFNSSLFDRICDIKANN